MNGKTRIAPGTGGYGASSHGKMRQKYAIPDLEVEVTVASACVSKEKHQLLPS